MQIASTGLHAIQNGYQLADDAAERVVRDGDLTALVDLNRAKREVEAGARLIRAEDDLTGTLLDVLA